MKHEQVVVDYWYMFKTSATCLLLAFFGYILIKMVQTIFWLPGYLQNNQKRLEELAAQYSVELNKENEEEKNVAAPNKESSSIASPEINEDVIVTEDKKEK
ncbi:uncharacterized protein LOC119683628 [Teleopsis dalmanni]|uniref:uncharacterized protein LOC119683628 n=1 Tax=Teleopsis dalmanni TaxID=139649 RepID=UPI0018CCED06|nr:uncharacterized protein LOC119683628 [Teleopsis dalmanni]